MLLRLNPKLRSALFVLVPLLAIAAGRLATHSELAARHPRTASLLFLWLCADSLALAIIAKAPRNRPEIRALLGAIAAGCVVATVGAAAPVRAALFDMQSVAIAMALTVALAVVWNLRAAAGRYRSSGSLSHAAEAILPSTTVKFAAKELHMLRLALVGWRLQPDVPQGARAFAYHCVINPMIAVFLVLQLIEIVVVDLLVSHWSREAAWVLLALGIWGALFFIAMMQGFRLYPVLLERHSLRVRSGLMIDLRVPLADIEAMGAAISGEELKQDHVLNAAILSHPNVVLQLARPLEYRPAFGKTRMVTRVAFRLDEPAPFVAALQSRI
ncbi:hypothetical protein K3152_12920 [Qipengyuania sp. 1NDH17]|uniref:Uncharacterized protein n=1 Tax=Qipengyuania polymorpha TaxID=2867234 RepID=A0ABS7IZZ8_9SPHN|nr:hypothetical protein [Qipengyuania polymorpha]MBX7459155.1 hypothetical protein [Qipengyuania polymorpha]